MNYQEEFKTFRVIHSLWASKSPKWLGRFFHLRRRTTSYRKPPIIRADTQIKLILDRQLRDIVGNFILPC